MSDQNHYLENARKCFQQAAKAVDVANARKFADLGMTYLQMAHDAAALVESNSILPRLPTMLGQ
jgi:hypothetical protein